ncbi:LuxR C-terminal-related transcriptional regulator [Streptomyces spongiae]|uniref:Response regulator transcription factor n=1 Tax=Streptomyces spongiae TaxID=565072 RepID=A0A5N8XFE4_9ACTN|nr:response regulator transcription factor [Streptomyces spongiae]MPY58182.1 response regulator transcription factor [Streptomyces spongiae]
MSRTTVLLFHEHSLVRLGVAALLSDLGGIAVRTAVDLREALDLAGIAPTPMVTLISVNFPHLDALLDQLRRRQSEVKERAGIAVALTGPGDSTMPLAAWPPGVHGYIPEDAAPDALGHAIRVLASGAVVFPSSLLSHAVDGMRSGAIARGEAVARRLSGREREVLGQLAAGCSNQHIAHKLGLSQGTVKSYVASIFVKIGAENRVQAALWAHGIGMPTTLDRANRTA